MALPRPATVIEFTKLQGPHSGENGCCGGDMSFGTGPCSDAAIYHAADSETMVSDLYR
jgi:hypothetical protein